MTRAAEDLGTQIVGNELNRILGGLSSPRPRRRSRSGVHFSYRPTPFVPRPLPDIDEERLVRVRQCTGCSLQYAIFGEHRYCPQCGPLPPPLIASDALAAETARLDALGALPAETSAGLREQGVFHRIWVDTLENAVGLVETLAGSIFREVVPNAVQLTQGKGNIFQRLDHTADLFVTGGFPDLRTVMDLRVWQRLLDAWAKRHAFVHNDGIVDDKYLTKVPVSTMRLGQRLTLTEPECRQILDDTRRLCDALCGLVSR